VDVLLPGQTIIAELLWKSGVTELDGAVVLDPRLPLLRTAEMLVDLRRAGIEPHAWIVNRALAGSGATDPLLRRRMAGEEAQVRRLRSGLAPLLYLLPWQARPRVGVEALRALSAVQDR